MDSEPYPDPNPIRRADSLRSVRTLCPLRMGIAAPRGMAGEKTSMKPLIQPSFTVLFFWRGASHGRAARIAECDAVMQLHANSNVKSQQSFEYQATRDMKFDLIDPGAGTYFFRMMAAVTVPLLFPEAFGNCIEALWININGLVP